MNKVIARDNCEYRMSKSLEENGISHGSAGIVIGDLYKGVFYHLCEKDYEWLANHLELFLNLFLVVEDSDVRYIKIMGMTLMSDDGFYWSLVSRTVDEK